MLAYKNAGGDDRVVKNTVVGFLDYDWRVSWIYRLNTARIVHGRNAYLLQILPSKDSRISMQFKRVWSVVSRQTLHYFKEMCRLFFFIYFNYILFESILHLTC